MAALDLTLKRDLRGSALATEISNSSVVWSSKQYSEVVKPLSQGGAVAGGVEKARVLEYDRRAKALNKKYREEQEISRRVFMVC